MKAPKSEAHEMSELEKDKIIEALIVCGNDYQRIKDHIGGT